MRFRDSSALVPLLAVEPQSRTVTRLLERDAAIVVAFITPVEVDSALWRKARQEKDVAARQRSHRRLAALEDDWTVVRDFDGVFAEARRIVRRRGLRGADAVQLACALRFRASHALPFVTLDVELASAARAEGFAVIP